MLLTGNHFSNPEVAAHLLYTKKTSIFHSTSMHYIPITNPYMKCIEHHFAPKLDPFNQHPSFLMCSRHSSPGFLKGQLPVPSRGRHKQVFEPSPWSPCPVPPGTCSEDDGRRRERPKRAAPGNCRCHGAVPSEDPKRKLL